MQGGRPFISMTALTFPHFAAQGSIRQHFPSSPRAVRVNESLSARVLLLLRPKAALSEAQRVVEERCGFGRLSGKVR
jgi:hypothetical protein